MNSFLINPLPVAVIGAGPIGLAAAAHLVERGIAVEIFESGDRIAANLESYRHVRLFSPWMYNVDGTAARLLTEEMGWTRPQSDVLPTAGEIIDDYLLPLSRIEKIAHHLHLSARVLGVSREGFDKVKTRGRESAPFILRVRLPSGVEEFRASAVIDATGTWSQANSMGAHGLPALGEEENADQIRYGMPDILGEERANYLGKKVLVVGSGHSAVGSLLALAELAEQDSATHIVWAVRGQDISKVFGGGVADGLPARGALGLRLRALVDGGRLEIHQGFKIRSISRHAHQMNVEALNLHLPGIYGVDRIVAATGARPDHSITRELRTEHDPWLESTVQLAPLIDPNEHSCGSVRPHGHRELSHPEVGFYAIGAKSYGRAPNFLMATGYEQARSVVAAIAGDIEAADAVRLELPQTGVCSSRLPGADDTIPAGCCAPSQTNAASANSCKPKLAPSNTTTSAGLCSVASCAPTPTESVSRCCG